MFLLIISLGCKDKSKNYPPNKVKSVKKTEIEKPKTEKEFILNDKNAIPFFMNLKKIIRKTWLGSLLIMVILILDCLITHHTIEPTLYI